MASGAYKLETVPCLCGRNENQLIASVDRYRLPHSTVLCLHCGLLRTAPRLTEGAYIDFYTNYYRAIYERIGHNPDDYYTFQFSRGMERFAYILRHVQPPRNGASVLEIGCGGGWNLQPFHQAGWHAAGWDFDRDYLKEGKRRGLDLREGSMDDAIAAGTKYHLIILSHVVEHLLNPVEDLWRLRSILQPAGMLFIEVPSLFAVTGDLLRYFQNAHTFSFVPETLQRVANAAGFRRIALSPVIQSLWAADARVPYPDSSQPMLVRRTLDYLWRRKTESRLYSRCRGLMRRCRELADKGVRPTRISLG
jgi:2-polyprenyl-3-methyl-5-hydroxy-6-metoxy-1,4-benzoquinol methylase